jgi:hypothetical protein
MRAGRFTVASVGACILHAIALLAFASRTMPERPLVGPRSTSDLEVSLESVPGVAPAATAAARKIKAAGAVVSAHDTPATSARGAGEPATEVTDGREIVSAPEASAAPWTFSPLGSRGALDLAQAARAGADATAAQSIARFATRFARRRGRTSPARRGCSSRSRATSSVGRARRSGAPRASRS